MFQITQNRNAYRWKKASVSDGDYLFDKIFLEANEHNQVCVYVCLIIHNIKVVKED